MRALVLAVLLMLAGCSSTGNYHYVYIIYVQPGQEATLHHLTVHITPIDKSTQGAVSSQQTVTPTVNATIPVVP